MISHHWKTHHHENTSCSDCDGIDYQFGHRKQHITDPIVLQAADYVPDAQGRTVGSLSSLVDAACEIRCNDLRQELPADPAGDGSFSAVDSPAKSPV